MQKEESVRKIYLLGACLMFFLFGNLAFSQSDAAKPADIVVLMDTSGTILQYYDDVNKRILSEISDKFVRKGDNFHLISFNANTQYEMSQVINTEADMSRVVSRFLLMYPLGQNSDFLSALKYSKAYASKFSSDNDRIMIIISDGIFNPPDSSEFKNYSGAQVKTYIAKVAGDLRAAKWKVYYVKLPFPSDTVIRDLDGNLYAKTLKDGTAIETNKDKLSVTDAAARSDERIDSFNKNGKSYQNRRTSSSNENRTALQSGVSAEGRITRNLSEKKQNKDNSEEPDTALKSSKYAEYTEDFMKKNGKPLINVPDMNGSIAKENLRQDLKEKNSVNIKRGGEKEKMETESGFETKSKLGTNSGQGTKIENKTEKLEMENDIETLNIGAKDTEGGNSENSDITDTKDTKDVESERIENEEDNLKKEFTDISREFTESLGIETSGLPEDENLPLVIEEDEALLPEIVFPSLIKISKNRLDFPLEIINSGKKEIALNLESVILENGNVFENLPALNGKIELKPGEKGTLRVKTQPLQAACEDGSHTVLMRLVFADNARVVPQASELVVNVPVSVLKKVSAFFDYKILIYVLLFVFLILFSLAAFFFLRGMKSRTKSHESYAVRKTDNSGEHRGQKNSSRTQEKKYPEQFEERSSSYSCKNNSADFDFNETNLPAAYGNCKTIFMQHRRSSRINMDAIRSAVFCQTGRYVSFAFVNSSEKIDIRHTMSIMTEIFVVNQNRNIGKRNIHNMQPGTRLYVGGGKLDDFMIFLVRFPSKLAQVSYDGKDYHLAILKPEYFPYESSNIVNNCIGKTITVVSDKGYHVYFTFRRYEDPVERLNNILKSINYKL